MVPFSLVKKIFALCAEFHDYFTSHGKPREALVLAPSPSKAPALLKSGQNC